MKFRGGEFSTGTTGNFQPELTVETCTLFDLYSIFGTVHFGNQSLGGVSYWNNFTCSALAQSREQRWRIGMLLRDTQKGPLISQRPFALIGSKNCSGET